jgi:hypothetical protein
VTIPAGNYDVYSFADLVNATLGTGKLVYNDTILGYTFTGNLVISANTNCQSLLGFRSGVTGTFSQSSQPVDFRGVQAIYIKTNISYYNCPISDTLAVIPVNVGYGDILNYADGLGTIPTFVCSHQPQIFQVQLVDEKGDELPNITDFPWYLTLELIEEK